jgi:hypothetical protein
VGSLKSSNANVSHLNVQGNSGAGESQHVVSQVYSNLMSGIVEPQPSREARATFYEPRREDIFRTR